MPGLNRVDFSLARPLDFVAGLAVPVPTAVPNARHHAEREVRAAAVHRSITTPSPGFEKL